MSAIHTDQSVPQVREYRPAQFEQLWALDQQCFSSNIAYSREELAHYLASKTSICLVASEQDQILGFILGDYHRGLAHIVTLDVAPTSQRSGLGSTLIRSLEQRFTSEECTSVSLEVAVNNRAALAFYKAHGYCVLKTLRRYYPGGLDGLVMRKRIGSGLRAAP